MLRDRACSTVIIEPPVARDSTTTNTSLAAAKMRLRSGNRNASGPHPGGDSEMMTPHSATAFHNLACSRGYTTSRPVATTAIGPLDPESKASITPWWAAASIPRAKPDTTATPLCDKSRPNPRAKCRPAALAARVPITPTRRCANVPKLPRANNTAGAAWSPRNTLGYEGSVANTTLMQWSRNAVSMRRSKSSVAACRQMWAKFSCANNAATRSQAANSPRTVRQASTAPSPDSSMRNRCGPTAGKVASAVAAMCSCVI